MLILCLQTHFVVVVVVAVQYDDDMLIRKRGSLRREVGKAISY